MEGGNGLKNTAIHPALLEALKKTKQVKIVKPLRQSNSKMRNGGMSGLLNVKKERYLVGAYGAEPIVMKE